MTINVREANLNEYGLFDTIKNSVDREKAKTFSEIKLGNTIPAFQLSMKIEKLLKNFILRGGYDIYEDNFE